MGGRRLLERVKNRLRGTERNEGPSTPSNAQPSKTPDTIVVPKISPLEKQEPDNRPPIAENAPPAVTTEPPLASNQSEKDSERKKLQEQLWNKAYDSLRDSGNKYMAQYEEILMSELRKEKPDGDSVSLGTTQEERWLQMQRLVEIGLSKTENEARRYEMANSGLELFGTVRALVEPAVSAVPQAAIPWVGVCFILEVISNPVKQPGVHRAGLQHVLSRVSWYWNLAELLLEDNLATEEYGGKPALNRLRGELQPLVLDLYQRFLSYLIESVCYFHKNRGLAFLKSVVNIDYWNGKIKDIEASEEEFNKRSQQYNTTESRNRLESLVIGVKSIEKAIDRQTEQQKKLNKDEGDKLCLRALYTTTSLYDKKRIEDDKGGLLSHCYSWIFLTEGFQTWQQDPDYKLLWIKGDPGKGKTMLLCGIIDRLDEMSPSRISCFFCQSTRNHQNNATAVLRGLVWSLAHQHPSLVSHVRTEFDSAGEQAFNGPNNWDILSSILRRMISDSSNHVPEGTTIVIDALDECNKDNKKLRQLIIELCSDKESPVRFIVSSRNWVEFQDAFTKKSNPFKRVILSLEDDEEVRVSIKHAVNAFIKYKVEQLERDKDTTIDAEVHNIFAEKSGNSFLWVALACQQLSDVDSWRILDKLKGFPPGLKDLYGRMMQEVMDSEEASQCRDILAVATLVYPPLSLVELSSGAQSLSQHANRPEALERQVLGCKGILVVKDGVVSFVHQSAKDFLLEDQLAKEFVWRAGMEELLSKNVTRSHRDILPAMLETMKKILKYDIYDLKNPGADVQDLDKRDAVDPLAPVRYACCYWADHIIELDDEAARAIIKFLKECLLYWLEACSLLGQVPVAVLGIQKLQKLAGGTEYHELVNVLRDTNRFVLYFKSAIERFPLQIYVSGLFFCPNASLARQAFKQHTFETSWIDIPISEDWDACVQTLEGHEAAITNRAFSGNNQWLASAADDYTVRIWDVATGVCLQTISTLYNWLHVVTFSSDSSCLAVAYENYTIQLYDTTGDEFKKTLTIETIGKVMVGLLFSPDDKWLACWERAYFGPEFQIRDAKTGDCIHTIRIEEKLLIRPETRRFSFSSDSQRILIGSEQPGVRDIGGCKWLTYADIRPKQLLTSAFCSDGTWVGHAFGKDSHSIWKFSDTDCNQVMEMLREDGPSAISNDGKQIATCTEYPLRLAIVDATTGEVAFADPRTMNAAGNGLPMAMAWSADNQWLAVGANGGNGQIRIWDPKAIKDSSGKEEFRKRIKTMALSLDGQRFPSGSEDGIIEVMHTARPANTLFTLQGHDSAIKAVVFSPSARMLATQYNSQFAFRQGENTIEVHDLKEKSMYELKWKHVSSLVFLPDGRSLAAVNWHDNVKVWDLQTKDAQEWMFKSHGQVLAIACSSDRKLLAYTISSGEIYIWQLGAEGCFLKLETEWMVDQLSFSPDSRSFITEHGRLIPEYWPSMVEIEDNTQVDAHQHERDNTEATTHENERGSSQIDNDENEGHSTEDDDDDENGVNRAQAIIGVDEAVDVSFSIEGYGIGFEDAWLTKEGKRLIWLPTEYRPRSVIVTGSVVVIRTTSDQLLMFGFKD
ncbi:unnamed protein product [Fusarium equiseti]|uniref:NACHT domain-containing protein n=1 Tax=Fusarium equiseti TaxID=61235 RepID=A0A8J2IZA8_FUSEQ|nr:unnamed protein product [Fusarium equiseti]